MDNAVQLSNIGIHDNATGRQLLNNHFNNVFLSNQSYILEAKGRIAINSLLAGPSGFRGVQSIWQRNKLITFMFFGG